MHLQWMETEAFKIKKGCKRNQVVKKKPPDYLTLLIKVLKLLLYAFFI